MLKDFKKEIVIYESQFKYLLEIKDKYNYSKGEIHKKIKELEDEFYIKLKYDTDNNNSINDNPWYDSNIGKRDGLKLALKLLEE